MYSLKKVGTQKLDSIFEKNTIYLTNKLRTNMQRKELSFSGQKIFIGIDVHKDSWRVAIAPEVGVVKGHSGRPSAKELLDF